MINLENRTLAEIKEAIEKKFSFEIMEYEKINKGYLNLKWKVITSKGTLFIKQYNEDRYPSSNEKRLERLTNALYIQKGLSKKGIKCPNILDVDDKIILRTEQNIRFIITGYKDGELINAGNINCNQFYDLGIKLGKIHNLVNNQADEKATPDGLFHLKKN